MDPKARQHDIVRVGWVIDAVPPGKRAARKHQVINGGGTCSSKKPETTPHVEQRRARAAIKNLSVLAHWFHQSIRRSFRGHRGFFWGS